jgi:cyclic pyranopterin phosphate synthase
MTFMTRKLSHLDEKGKARMVDVGDKEETERVAIAMGEVIMKAETLQYIEAGLSQKGDVLAVAQIAGIIAAKRTSELIPLCHTFPISEIKVDITVDKKIPGVQITSSVKAVAKTGVEMEALTATAVAALTIYDMLKAVEKTMKIQNIRLYKKTGGVSGDVLNE